MNLDTVRVRFAPAPTGIMHIGNIRTALMNYLFAKQKNGTFVLRIEDTDLQRNFDPSGHMIIQDLTWLHLNYDEGPEKGGPFKPYFQSQRLAIYQEKLNDLKEKNCIYRCFCSEEELEKKRQRQQALKLPPRYDRMCDRLSPERIDELLAQNHPFIWRIRLDHNASITIHDLARDTVKFELKNFSDFPLTRRDGTFTFMFANFVDDLVMNISYVFRGEDHLSNTAGQAALYTIFNAPLPVFWHMPILCNTDGKKLSKRDFGFSLHDLKDAGFVPEAIVNYLGIIGGSFKQEIMSLDELIKTINFDHRHATGQIRYDVKKLTWINRHWLTQYDPEKLTALCMPFLQEAYPTVKDLDRTTITTLLQTIKSDLTTTKDSVAALQFYFIPPEISQTELQACLNSEHIPIVNEIVTTSLPLLNQPTTFANAIKTAAQEKNIPLKELFWFLRLALMGSTQGPTIHDLVAMLGEQESKKRIEKSLNLLRKIT